MIDRLTIAADVTLREIPGNLATAGQCHNEIAAVHDSIELPTLLGAAFRGVDTNLEPVKNTLHCAQSIDRASCRRRPSNGSCATITNHISSSFGRGSTTSTIAPVDCGRAQANSQSFWVVVLERKYQ